MAYDNSNKGSLWRERKERVSNKTGKPYGYYSGDCVIDGKAYWINAFLNEVETKDGKKEVYNMSFTLKQQASAEGDATYAADGTKIPF